MWQVTRLGNLIRIPIALVAFVGFFVALPIVASEKAQVAQTSKNHRAHVVWPRPPSEPQTYQEFVEWRA